MALSLDELSLPNLSGMSLARHNRKRLPALDEDTVAESESLLRQAGRTALGGLAWAGNLLDTDSAFVRNLLVGNNPLPGIMDSEQRVSGRDMLEKWGLLGPNTPGLDFGDVLGFGAEVVTDPKTYMTLGMSALGKAGQIAKKAGFLKKLPELAAKAGTGTRVAKMKTSLRDLMAHVGPDAEEQALKALGATPEMLQEIRAGGAISPAAQKIRDSLDLLRDEKLGGLMGYGLPFRDPVGTFFSGPMSQKVAGWMDKTGRRLTTGNPVGRWLGQQLNYAKRNASTQFVQERAPWLTQAEEAIIPRSRQLAGDIADAWDEFGARTLADDSLLRDFMQAQNATEEGAALLNAQRLLDTPEKVAKLRKLKGEWHALRDEMFSVGKVVGAGPREQLTDVGYGYLPRAAGKAASEVGLPEANYLQFGSSGREALTRKGYIRDLKESLVRELWQDDDIAKLIPKDRAPNANELQQIASLIESKYGKRVSKEFYEVDELIKRRKYQEIINNSIDPKEIAEYKRRLAKIKPHDRYETLAKKIVATPEEVRKSGLFANTLAQDIEDFARHGLVREERSNWLLNALADPSIQMASNSKQAVKVTTILKKLGLKQGDAQEGALRALANRMGIPNTNMPLFDLKKEINKIGIRKAEARDLLRAIEGFKVPEGISTAGKWTDTATNIWKGMATSPNIAFQIRNLFSGGVRNVLDKAFGLGEAKTATQLGLGQVATDAINNPLVREEAIRQGITNVTPEIADKLLRKKLWEYSLEGGHMGDVGQGAGDVGMSLDAYLGQRIGAGLPGTIPGFLKDVGNKFLGRSGDTTWRTGATTGLKKILPKSVGDIIDKVIDPTKPIATVRGALDPNKLDEMVMAGKTTFAPLAAGEQVGRLVEDVNRVTPFLDMVKRGVDPEEAKRLVDAAQVAYSNRYFTPTERVLSRLIPFYKFGKGTSKHTLKELAERPGGPLAQLIRATTNMRSGDVVLPDYVAQGLAIPLGRDAQGDDRYITGFGLMHEQDPFQFMGGGIKGAGQELLSRLNPAIKGPIEYFAGKSFFQRGPAGPRELEDLDPLLGRTKTNILQTIGAMPEGYVKAEKYDPLVEQVLANTLGRQAAQVRTAFDPRKEWWAKALNLGTGIRVSDVPLPAREAILREQVEGLSRRSGAKVFEKVYFSKQDIQEAKDRGDVEAAHEMEVYNNTLNILAQRAKQRAKEQKKK